MTEMNESLLNASTRKETKQRLRIVIYGMVQGIGFRPFVYRLASHLGLQGWVGNTSQGVVIEVEGEQEILEAFLARLESEKPSLCVIQGLETSCLDAVGYGSFEIRESETGGDPSAFVLPDIAACQECVKEIFQTSNRRYQYPFTNCTHCGPRFTIVESLPYDRAKTVMKKFVMCADCQKEYEDPSNRRFHAQPNACARCGPHLEFWTKEGKVISRHREALLQACEKIKQGKIAAVKGLGGFHLMADARSEAAVNLLRQRKHREEKPFAVMYPDLESIKSDCEVNFIEERLLTSQQAPIVLLRKKHPNISPFAAPENPYLGVMLPYTPLHHLMLKRLGFPVIATSGNLSEEPIVTDEYDALKRLGSIADFFLVHNRPIVRHADDSIVRVVAGREMILRRARGYAPFPLTVTETFPPLLAVGGHLKNTIASARGKNMTLSQHIGDLESHETFQAFQKAARDLTLFQDLKPEALVCDLHPEYRSSQYAQDSGLPVVKVQHHYAHVLACALENEIEPPFLGVAWDGTGFGTDGTLWGGEFLSVKADSFERLASFRLFPLPGAEQSIREPRRTALGVLYELFGDSLVERNDFEFLNTFSREELAVLKRMLEQRISTPLTSSAGRLFDAVSALLNLRPLSRFEGQAAMTLEFALEDGVDETYPFRMGDVSRARVLKTPENPKVYPRFVIDWAPIFQSIICDQKAGLSAGVISAKFHNTLAEIITTLAERSGETRVVLSGGCFQNKYLTERTIAQLRAKNFRPYWHQRIPTNDGGIAVGQLAAARISLRKGQ